MEEKNYVMNDEGEFGKYVVQTLRTPKFSPEFQEIYKQWGRRLLWIDGNTVPGAFQMNMTWYVNAPDMRPLIEVGIGGELHRLTKSSIIFMPAGMKHLPLSIISLERPILHFSISMNPEYSYTPTKKEDE